MTDSPDDHLQRLQRLVAEWQTSMEAVRAQIAGEVDRMRKEIESLRAELGASRQAKAAAAREAEAQELRQALQEMAQLRAELNNVRSNTVPRERHDELEEQLTRALADRAEALDEIERLRSAAQANADVATAPTVYASSHTAVSRLRARDAQGKRLRMGEVLRDAGVITTDQLLEALNEQGSHPHRRLGAILIELGYTGQDVIAQVLASQLGLRFVRLASEQIDELPHERLPLRVAHMHMCFPLRMESGDLLVAMSNPFDLVAIDDIEKAANRRVSVVVATEGDIRAAIEEYYGVQVTQDQF